jgi:hypothetical protein
MKDWKLTGRLMGFLHKRFKELMLEKVDDPRDSKGKRWQLGSFLRAVVSGMISGQKSLRDVESMTDEMSMDTRKLLGIKKRIPDTTMRDCLVNLLPSSLREILHLIVHSAIRRKALEPVGLPCGVVAMDGKWTATKIADKKYTQHHSDDGRGNHIEQLRTVTSCLISSKAKVCLDALPIPPETNEKGIFKNAFDSLLKTYPNLFEIITYDAGGNSEENARYVNDQGVGYVFSLKDDQKTIFEESKRLLGDLTSDQKSAETRDYIGGKTIIRRLWKTTEIAGWHGWDHLRMVIRVQSITLDDMTGGIESTEDRYFITNVHIGRLKNEQWLMLIRLHWGVENNCHNIWDRIFREDDHPWIYEPQGMLAIQLLRRLSYNLMALFRGVTQRSEDKREMPWKDLMRQFYLAFIRFTSIHLPTGSKLKENFTTSH